ncbi:armadillo-type protein [Melampsora americana]|nr:armadillo-type protein [Melampsora americana]
MSRVDELIHNRFQVSQLETTQSQSTTTVNHIQSKEKTSLAYDRQKGYRKGEDEGVLVELITRELRRQIREDTSHPDERSSQQEPNPLCFPHSLPDPRHRDEEQSDKFPTLETYKLNSILKAWPEARCRQYLAQKSGMMDDPLPPDHATEARELVKKLNHSLLLLTISAGLITQKDVGSPISINAHVGKMIKSGMEMDRMFLGETVKPLKSSANSWTTARSNHLEEDSAEMVNRKVRGLLNKLTLDKFESISDQVIDWANKSEKENDGRILKGVVGLICENRTDEAHWSEMYAKLCGKLMEKLSPEVKDENVLDTAGNKVHGGQLFRKYLLNRCQEDYERAWKKGEELVVTGTGKASYKSKRKAKLVGKHTVKEVKILSDEDYVAQKAERQGLGLVRFLGELFNLNMLSERIMHECIKKLLSNIEDPEEEDIESLCRLMMTIGKKLDHEKANSHMNLYFTRMVIMTQSHNLSPRLRFMIQDVIDKRNDHWIERDVTNTKDGPKRSSRDC